LHSAVETRLKDDSGRYSPKSVAGISLFFSEFGTLVLPLLLSMTLFAARPLLLGFIITLTALLVIVLRPSHLTKSALLPTPTSHSGHALSRPSSPPSTPTRDASLDILTQNHTHPVSTVEPTDHSSAPVELARKSKPHMVLSPVPYLTIYRSHMILMTIIAILAVDFPVFPRYLAKCESFGVSLVCAPLLSVAVLQK
jgi:phosphatidylinositol glycan class W